MPISVESIEALLRLKLKERVAPGSTLLNTGFRLFGRPENGITVENFRKTLANLGIILSLADAPTIFDAIEAKWAARRGAQRLLLQLAADLGRDRRPGARATTTSPPKGSTP